MANEEIMIDVVLDDKGNIIRQHKFCKSTLYKTKGRGPISNKVMDAKIAQDMGGV